MADEEAGGEGGEKQEAYPYGRYEGGRDDQLERHGFGRAVLPNGDFYEGNYNHGKRHDKGLYVFKNGSRYDGEWKNGVKYGKGEFIYPDGSRYVGEWKRDLKHGKGIYYYVNGDSYEGSWYKGFRHGYGTYIYKSTNVIHTGNWKDGRMEGPGIIDYGCYKYHGKFEKNLPKGPGCFVFENKYMQHGYYVNLRNPAFDYVGADKFAPENTNLDSPDYRGNPRGIVPLWRARSVTPYKKELLPPEPLDIPIADSQQSLIDILGYLQQYDKEAVGKGDVEEEQHLTSPATEKGDAVEGLPPDIPTT